MHFPGVLFSGIGKCSFFLAPVACALLSALNCMNPVPGREKASSASADAVPPVVEVRKGTIRKQLLLDGELRAVNSREIYATTTEEAKITYLPPEGSIAKPGDRLVELDSGTLLGKLKDVEEKIVAADNEITRTRSTHEGALREMDLELSRLWLAREQARVKAVVPVELVARREYQENQLALEKSRAEYQNQLSKIEQRKKEQAAEIQVKALEKEQLGVQLRKIRGNIDGMNIRAPAEGMVIYGDHWMERRKLQVGDVVWGGFPLVRLPDLRQMEVVARINEVDGPRIAVGQSARIRLDSFPEEEITGAVKEISQSAIKAGWMAKAKIFVATISLDRTLSGIMKPGMSTQISIVCDESRPLLLVPRSAVRFDRDSACILRLEGESRLREIAVTVVSGDASVFGVPDNGALKAGDRILSRWRASP
jgi:multidrug efflux pump subunit AcrA (membrane-fusion protein)